MTFKKILTVLAYGCAFFNNPVLAANKKNSDEQFGVQNRHNFQQVDLFGTSELFGTASFFKQEVDIRDLEFRTKITIAAGKTNLDPTEIHALYTQVPVHARREFVLHLNNDNLTSDPHNIFISNIRLVDNDNISFRTHDLKAKIWQDWEISPNESIPPRVVLRGKIIKEHDELKQTINYRFVSDEVKQQRSQMPRNTM